MTVVLFIFSAHKGHDTNTTERNMTLLRRGLMIAFLLSLLPLLAAGCSGEAAPLDNLIEGPALILFYTDN